MSRDAPPDRASVYGLPRIYDIAFGYRNVPREVAVVLGWYAACTGSTPPRRVLELACGPGNHARAFAEAGLEVLAIDQSEAMCAYAREKLAGLDLPITIRHADMTRFAVSAPVELAASMLDSVSHLLDLDAMVNHLTAVRAALRPGGIYIAEMAHPGDFMTTRPRTITRWVQRRGDTEVRIAWGADGDRFDPTTQTGQATVLIRVTGPGGIRTVVDQVAYRRWTPVEMQAAARLAGLEVLRWYGALEADAPFDNEPGAWRMIPVLRRPR